MPRQKTSTAKKTTPVESLRHKDKRANIPTEELRDFVAEEEKKPKTILYPRDASLDPQLVWKGKDEQDQEDLAVPAVPIYIQEKIHPQAIIDALPRIEQPRDDQINLFADFNGGPVEFEQKVDFYHHEQNWSNRMILGDSLLVMTSLAEKEGLKSKVQMIYIDPPYGIRFGSNWQVSTRKRDVKDGKAEDATRQPEQIKAFRDTWQLGIHSYLAYLRDRLTVARELLTESGSVFVQIGDENVHLVRCLMDEVFGSENSVSLVSFVTTSGFPSLTLSRAGDYLLWYAKDRDRVKYRQIYRPKEPGDEGAGEYKWVVLPDGSTRSLTPSELSGKSGLPEGGRAWRYGPLTSSGPSEEGSKPFVFRKGSYSPGVNNHWKVVHLGLERLCRADLMLARENSLAYFLFADNYPVVPINNNWVDTKWGFDAGDKMYVVQTNTKVIERCLLMTTDPGDLVLDPTCGSGTTAYVAEQWGRRWITCDTSRVALALARTRLMSAKFPYYLLADSPEGAMKDAELTGSLTPALSQRERGSGEADIKKGFVYKRVPHVTLKSIANNAEIDAIHAKWQEKLEPLRAKINKQAKHAWEEWEVPRELPEELLRNPKSEIRNLHSEWWSLRRDRQKEIDDSIARHADTEILYDDPYPDNQRVRVTGPFTVESLSPHRVLATESAGTAEEILHEPGNQFVHIIIDNLRKAGVQNTVKNERLKFDRLEPFAGTWLHADGDYVEKDGTARRVAISIGPEHGTVGPEQVKEAAKEALRGVGFDLLIVCGFAFDAHAGETAEEFTPEETEVAKKVVAETRVQRFGKLAVLLARMNPDLAMGDELLKKTGAGNLFMVFGEPDVEITKQKDGLIVAEIKGVDVYDPTTGQIRSASTDDIACWFIDTDYNGESFFVRHAYFTGAEEPYDKLKRALRAKIDEAAWSSLYSTVSRPFAKPESGKIAVKVINHYGDEVMKVFEV